MSYSTEQVLTYTPGYGSELQDIEINKIYEIEINKCCMDKINNFNYPFHFNKKGNGMKLVCYNKESMLHKIIIKWTPRASETHIEINKNVTIIDSLLINRNTGSIDGMYMLDNYGNKYIGKYNANNNIYHSGQNINNCILFESDILLQKDDEMLSDQVIDYIKQNNLIYILDSVQLKQIQKLAGMGREKTIRYVMEYPQSIVEVEYDKNDIIKELNIAFPGCDPWDKAKELFDKYDSMNNLLIEEYEKDTELMRYCIHEKNNIEKLISRNKDIDDEDIKNLIEIKCSKLKNIESQIEGILEKNDIRREKINKLNLLLCKLDVRNIPEKKLTTDFVFIT